MKKIISILMVLALCMSISLGAFASEFVPSISYKDGPNVIEASLNGEDVRNCLVVTTIKNAENKTTDISEAEREALLEIYEKLTSGEMKLPLKNKYVIRELLDLSFMYNSCRNDSAHGGKEDTLKQNGVTLTANFDLGIAQGENLKVLVYVNNEWKPVKAATINENGTVTVEFEEICPVAFCIETDGEVNNPEEDSNIGAIITLVTALVAVVTAIVILAIKFLIPKR